MFLHSPPTNRCISAPSINESGRTPLDLATACNPTCWRLVKYDLTVSFKLLGLEFLIFSAQSTRWDYIIVVLLVYAIWFDIMHTDLG